VKSVTPKILIKRGFYELYGAGTGHVLLRKDMVNLLDKHYLALLDSGEDMYIAQQIVKSGYYYVRDPRLRAIHHSQNLC